MCRASEGKTSAIWSGNTQADMEVGRWGKALRLLKR
jgi:hypothetical protein